MVPCKLEVLGVIRYKVRSPPWFPVKSEAPCRGHRVGNRPNGVFTPEQDNDKTNGPTCLV